MVMARPTRSRRATLVPGHRLLVLLGVVLLAMLAGAPGTLAAPGILDGPEDAKKVAEQGFALTLGQPSDTLVANPLGTFLNSYNWSSAWFGNRQFVGTVRREGTVLNQLRAQIWRYTPAGVGGLSGTWTRVLESPLSAFLQIPRDIGYRWMTVCNIGGGPKLFVSTLGAQQGRILYTSDGNTFQEASLSGLQSQDVGFRTVSCFKTPNGTTALVISPVGIGGQTTFDPDASNRPIVLINTNPTGGGTWQAYSPLRMGDSTNNSFFTIETFDTNNDGVPDRLYVGVANTVTGAQIWKTAGCNLPCTPTWTKVIDQGAGRPTSPEGLIRNVGVSDMAQHFGALYAGLSTSAGDQVPAELLRINPNLDPLGPDTWDLVIGQPRLNIDANPAVFGNLVCSAPANLDGGATSNDCAPLSGRGAGFGPVTVDGVNFPNGNQSYFWRLLSYRQVPVDAPQGDDRLYMGTLEGFGGGGVSGFDLLATADDGLTWVQLTNDGFGNPNQGGLRSINASPIGLAIGSANFPPGGTTDPGGAAFWFASCHPDLIAANLPFAAPRACAHPFSASCFKPARPGQVVEHTLTTPTSPLVVAYDDENHPNAGDGKVVVTLDGSTSNVPFCGGDVASYAWEPGDQLASCAALTGTLGTTPRIGPFTLCTSASDTDAFCQSLPRTEPSGSGYTEYTFTLKITDTPLSRPSCRIVTVRASATLPPDAIILPNPPAVVSSSGTVRVSLADFDGNGSEMLSVQGHCPVRPGQQLASCIWSTVPGAEAATFAGATLPLADADPAAPGTTYTATVPAGEQNGTSDIFLTAIDTQGNTAVARLNVRVRSTVDDPAPENDNPVCRGATATIPRTGNPTLTINPSDPANRLCLDPEGAALTYQIRQQPPAGHTATGGVTVTYVAPSNFEGTAFFAFRACDPSNACSDDVGVRVTVTAPPESIAPVTAITGGPAEGATIGVRTATFTWSATHGPAPGSLPLTYATRLHPMEPNFSGFSSSASRTFSNLPDGGPYTFHVIAKDAVGNTEAQGGPTNQRTFTVSVTPTISGFSPGSGAVGASVVITGTNFTGATSVKFNGTAATFAVNSGTQITATVPTNATTGPIVITAPGGTATSATPFTVAARITSFSPSNGVAGATVTINGVNFTGATAVTFNGASASFSVVTSIKITATVPAGATSGKIGVTTAAGSATSAGTFTVKPHIASFTPGHVTAGAAVTISGTALAGATSVKFNGVAAAFHVDSSAQITATVPAKATSGPLSVTTPAGKATSATSFTVAPRITSFKPVTGMVGTKVTITGANLTGATSVAFNGQAASYVVNSARKITATVPAGATTGTISVTTPAGTATSTGTFTIP